MGWTNEECISEQNQNGNKKLVVDDNIFQLDLNDIEKQGESKNPQRIKINNNNDIEEENYYNYNLNDLVPINKTKMTVKRIENFDDVDDDDENESESEEDNQNLEKIKEENNDDVNENENIEQNENIKENKDNNNNFNEIGKEEDKKPEDKKPPKIEKLKKKGKDKKDIILF